MQMTIDIPDGVLQAAMQDELGLALSNEGRALETGHCIRARLQGEIIRQTSALNFMSLVQSYFNAHLEADIAKLAKESLEHLVRVAVRRVVPKASVDAVVAKCLKEIFTEETQ
jgi:hypothetical protein